MDQAELERDFKQHINQNFKTYHRYLNYKYREFFELDFLIPQAAKCLILQLNVAAITVTNHILERLLKLALISTANGGATVDIFEMNKVFDEADANHGSKELSQNADQCCSRALITKDERDHLKSYYNDVRNGFSHADPKKLLKGKPMMVKMMQFSLTNPNERKEAELNVNTVPFLQADKFRKFAEIHAFKYFDYVFDLMTRMEERIVNLRNSQT